MVQLATIIISALFAGFVATMVTVLIERWGGLIGGVLGTAPSTIIPAAIGMYTVGTMDEFHQSLSIIPFGMLLNIFFLGVWLVAPHWFSQSSHPLVWTMLIALLVWCVLGIVLLFMLESFSQSISSTMIALLGGLAVIVAAIGFNLKPHSSPKGSKAVSQQVLVARGSIAAVAIGIAVWLKSLGWPLVAGLASVFPAIFLTSMVALWLAQGIAVPRGAAGPMMIGGVSVAFYANIAMWAFPVYGPWYGTLIAWFGSVLIWSLPAFFIVRRRQQRWLSVQHSSPTL